MYSAVLRIAAMVCRLDGRAERSGYFPIPPYRDEPESPPKHTLADYNEQEEDCSSHRSPHEAFADVM